MENSHYILPEDGSSIGRDFTALGRVARSGATFSLPEPANPKIIINKLACLMLLSNIKS